jgi:hypothetical protein
MNPMDSLLTRFPQLGDIYDAVLYGDDVPMPPEKHAGKCCEIHGCNYREEHCPVETGSVRQSDPCTKCRSVKELLSDISDAQKELALLSRLGVQR